MFSLNTLLIHPFIYTKPLLSPVKRKRSEVEEDEEEEEEEADINRKYKKAKLEEPSSYSDDQKDTSTSTSTIITTNTGVAGEVGLEESTVLKDKGKNKETTVSDSSEATTPEFTSNQPFLHKQPQVQVETQTNISSREDISDSSTSTDSTDEEDTPLQSHLQNIQSNIDDYNPELDNTPPTDTIYISTALPKDIPHRDIHPFPRFRTEPVRDDEIIVEMVKEYDDLTTSEARAGTGNTFTQYMLEPEKRFMPYVIVKKAYKKSDLQDHIQDLVNAKATRTEISTVENERC